MLRALISTELISKKAAKKKSKNAKLEKPYFDLPKRTAKNNVKTNYTANHTAV